MLFKFYFRHYIMFFQYIYTKLLFMYRYIFKYLKNKG